MKASGSEVLSMIEDGGKLDAIESVTLWDRADIMEVARDEGYALDAASGRFRPAPKAKPAPTGVIRSVPDPLAARVPDPGVRPVVRDLIGEGRASSVTKVKRAAAKAQAALDHLAAVLEETREAEATGYVPTGNAAEVRAWAAANGIECPSRGIVPRAVVEQYQATLAGAA